MSCRSSSTDLAAEPPAERRRQGGITCIGGRPRRGRRGGCFPAPTPTRLDAGHPVAARLEQHADGGGGHALAQAADHATCGSMRTTCVSSAQQRRSGGRPSLGAAAAPPGPRPLLTGDQHILHAARSCWEMAAGAPARLGGQLSAPCSVLQPCSRVDVHKNATRSRWTGGRGSQALMARWAAADCPAGATRAERAVFEIVRCSGTRSVYLATQQALATHWGEHRRPCCSGGLGHRPPCAMQRAGWSRSALSRGCTPAAPEGMCSAPWARAPFHANPCIHPPALTGHSCAQLLAIAQRFSVTPNHAKQVVNITC